MYQQRRVSKGHHRGNGRCGSHWHDCCVGRRALLQEEKAAQRLRHRGIVCCFSERNQILGVLACQLALLLYPHAKTVQRIPPKLYPRRTRGDYCDAVLGAIQERQIVSDHRVTSLAAIGRQRRFASSGFAQKCEDSPPHTNRTCMQWEEVAAEEEDGDNYGEKIGADLSHPIHI